MFRALAAALSTTLLGLSACQPAATTTTPRQVHSVGYGHVTVYPDYAELTVDADFTRPRLRDAVMEVQRVVDQVLSLSKRYASGRDDVRVSSTSSNKEFKYDRKGNEVFAGFKSTQSVTVRINDLRRLSPYLEELLATPISRIKDLSYGHSQADSLRREADVLALADAVKTADKMCAALHVKRGQVLEVSDNSSPESSNTNGYRPVADMELYSKSFGGRGFKMSPELLRFDSQCSLSSALE